jgi:hypothetical protein
MTLCTCTSPKRDIAYCCDECWALLPEHYRNALDLAETLEEFGVAHRAADSILVGEVRA